MFDNHPGNCYKIVIFVAHGDIFAHHKRSTVRINDWTGAK